LVNTVAAFLDREDMSAVHIPNAIVLVDAKLDRELRKTVTRRNIVINSDVENLPDGASEVRYLRLNEAGGFHNKPLEQTTPLGLADSSSRFFSAGRPTRYAVVDGQMIFDRTPADAYDAEIVYYNAHTPLDPANAGTWSLLAAEPDLYLEGVLYTMFTFLQHDERVPEHKMEFEKIIASINNKRARVELGAAPQPIRLPVVFGRTIR
jgi:hypothetical protein